ncbi:RHS repeat-associated core domain-containing protein [Methylomonas sp. BW4-1]|uniref:RHS repeat-associated core domain-containing protein n=1 Tax=Methylomonas sp. BW4-1 TaxID=3376685 RepID=UPI0040419F04
MHEQDNTQANGATYHYHLDHLGTPRELTDTDGRIVWSARYRAYGNLALADVEVIDNPLRFQGQYYDQETGLHYNLNRYYDPNAGRFIHQDPIGLAGGANVYRYVPNPINWIDPIGLDPLETLAERGFSGVTKTAGGGLDYSASNALYTKPGVNPIQEITYSGDYILDFEAASQQALGQKSTPKGYVWHHLDDYNPQTNKGTMQLVKREAHLGIPHSGGVAQYQKTTGEKYTFPCRG